MSSTIAFVILPLLAVAFVYGTYRFLRTVMPMTVIEKSPASVDIHTNTTLSEFVQKSQPRLKKNVAKIVLSNTDLQLITTTANRLVKRMLSAASGESVDDFSSITKYATMFAGDFTKRLQATLESSGIAHDNYTLTHEINGDTIRYYIRTSQMELAGSFDIPVYKLKSLATSWA